MREHALRHDYSAQAGRYDATRGVSPDVIGAITTALNDAPGRTLLDVGGGTGNYAAALRDLGWAPTTNLPIAEETYDAVTMISMLHQVGDWKTALTEAQRVLRPHGALVVMG